MNMFMSNCEILHNESLTMDLIQIVFEIVVNRSAHVEILSISQLG